MREGRDSVCRQAMRGGVTAALCVLMVAPGAFAAEAPGAASGSQKIAGGATGRLTEQERVLHALDRLTFGPRPGDVAAVERMGLDAWFEDQLHPESIDDAALEARLNAFPAMRLSEEELVQRFPTPGMIRQLQKTGASPSDPVEHAIYLDAIENYEVQKRKQELAGAQPQGGAQAGNGQPPLMGQSQISTAGQQMGPAVKRTGDPDTDNLMQNLTMVANGQSTVADVEAGKKGGRRNVPRLQANEVQEVLALAPEERFGRLVMMSPESMEEFRVSLKPFQRAKLVEGMTPQQMEAVEAMQGPEKVVDAEVLESRLVRDIYSERQLQAVMADFWLNHFNVYIRKNQNEPYLLPGYLRETILPHALGKFEDLLVATAQSPAMLMYLDNWQSIGPNSLAAVRAAKRGGNAKGKLQGINENYGRELMELHTLGVNGGYTQKDVIEVAKCFTGWTIDRPYQVGTGGTGGFVYEPNRHEPGAKKVLGKKIPEGGEQEGLTVLHMLATSPATAHHISYQLAVRFVSDDPSPKLVDAMAATFLKSDGDIKAVLRTMFHSPEFWSPKVYRAKVKTPIEFLASAVRASDAEVKNPLPLAQSLNRLGMPLYGMQTPNGYSWTSDAWVSSNALISRMNFALVLSGNRLPETQTNWPAVLGDSAEPNVAMDPTSNTEKQLEALLLGQPATLHTRDTVLAQFKNPTAQQDALDSFTARQVDMQAGEKQDAAMMRVGLGKKNGGGPKLERLARPETPLDTMAGLLLGSPEFQRR